MKDKITSNNKTGGGPPDAFTDQEKVWYDIFGRTSIITGIVDKDDNSQEIGLPGETLLYVLG